MVILIARHNYELWFSWEVCQISSHNNQCIKQEFQTFNRLMLMTRKCARNVSLFRIEDLSKPEFLKLIQIWARCAFNCGPLGLQTLILFCVKILWIWNLRFKNSKFSKKAYMCRSSSMPDETPQIEDGGKPWKWSKSS